MPTDYLEYERRGQQAMRELVRESLATIARDGLLGDHQLYIVFDTRAPGVELSRKVRKQFPTELSVILQYQFTELKVEDQRFSVVLSFGGRPEKIVVPFAAMTAFHDPSVRFSLRFDLPANVNQRHDTSAEPEAPKTLHCAFCGQPREGDRKLAFGRGVCICDACVERVAAEFREEAAASGASPTG
jgi:uncharacterized protein